MTNDYRLQTPESVGVDYTLAGIGSRFLAQLIDGLIIAAGFILLVIAALSLSLAGQIGESAGAITAITGSFILIFGYFLLYETLWHGQTPGKRALDIRVIKTTGYPIGFSESAIRNIVRIVDFLPGSYGVGVVCMFVSTESRRLGDYAAGTIVIREREVVTIADVTREVASTSGWMPQPPAIGEIDPDELDWNLRGLGSDDVQLVRAFLSRAPQLDTPVRDRIGGEVSQRVAARIGAREPLDAVRFLNRVMYLLEGEDAHRK